MFDLFPPTSPFFIDEFIFNEGDDERRQRTARQDDDFSVSYKTGPDCNRVLTVYRTDSVIRCDCGGRSGLCKFR